MEKPQSPAPEAKAPHEHEHTHPHNPEHAAHEAKKAKESANSKIKPMHIAAAVIVLAVLFVGYLGLSGASATTVAVGDNVSVNYTGSFTNGTVFDSSALDGKLFNFTVGANEVIPGFDQAVIGMKLNQEKTVTLAVNEAYGPVNPALIVQVPIANFANSSVQVGQRVTDSQGQQAVVTEVNLTTVTVNFNPPLAGQVLVFNITVVGIRHNG